MLKDSKYLTLWVYYSKDSSIWQIFSTYTNIITFILNLIELSDDHYLKIFELICIYDRYPTYEYEILVLSRVTRFKETCLETY